MSLDPTVVQQLPTGAEDAIDVGFEVVRRPILDLTESDVDEINNALDLLYQLTNGGTDVPGIQWATPAVDLATKQQPNPTGNGVDIAVEAGSALRSMGLDSLADDIEARIQMGEKKYGSRLRAFNGRDVFTDLGQELLDAINYSKQAQLERKDDGSLFKLVVAVTVLVEKKWKSLDSYQEKELWTSLLRSIDEILKTK